MGKLADELRAKKKAAMGQASAPAPAAFRREEPAVDDSATTNEIPIKPAPAAPASKPRAFAAPAVRKHPDEDKLTKPVDLSAKAAAMAAVPEADAPVRVVPPPPAVRPVAAGASAPAVAPGEKLVGPGEEGEPSGQDDTQILEKLKAHVAKLLEPLQKAVDEAVAEVRKAAGKVEELEGSVSELRESVQTSQGTLDAIVDELDGCDGEEGDVVDRDEQGAETERRPSLKKRFESVESSVAQANASAKGASEKAASVSGAIADLRSSLFGENPEEALGNFGGSPVVQSLLDEVVGAGDAVEALSKEVAAVKADQEFVFGPGHERKPGWVDSYEVMTRRVLIRALKQVDYVKEVGRVAVEQGPVTSQEILKVIAEDVRSARAALAQEQNSSIVKIDDPELASDKKLEGIRRWVDENTPKIRERAKECLDKINWDDCVEKNRVYVDGGDA
ncbi:MAG: hypothetical protein U0R44_05960 [Candidatus Micrarchaeia archaeon]